MPYYKKAISFDVVTALYNTIGIEHDFGGSTTADLGVRANGAQTQRMFYNPLDTKHYWTGWFPENTAVTIEITDDKGDARTASSTTLITPSKPTRSTLWYVAADKGPGEGDLTSSVTRGSLTTAMATAVSDTQIELKAGTYAEGSDLSLGSGDNNISVVAESGTVIITGARQTSQTWVNEEITSGESTGTHTGSDGVAILEDTTQSWTVDALIGRKISNNTDGSTGVITDNSTNSITANLVGGTNNDWTSGSPGDSYTIDRMIGVYSILDHDNNMHQLHATISGTVQRIQKYDTAGELNDANHGWTMNLPVHDANGQHTAGTSSTVLTDSNRTWTVDELIGLTATNTSVGESGIITANTATTATVTLSGGEDWEVNDDYIITPKKLLVKLSSTTLSTTTVTPTSSIMHLPLDRKNLLTTSGDDIWIEDIIFEHAGAGENTPPSVQTKGIDINGATVAVVKGCTFRHCSFTGLDIATSTDVLVDNCTALNNLDYMTESNIKSGPEGSEVGSRISFTSSVTRGTIRNCTLTGGIDLMAVKGGSMYEINVHGNSFTKGLGETFDMDKGIRNLRRWNNTYSNYWFAIGMASPTTGPVWIVNDKCTDGGYLLPIDLDAGTSRASSATKFNSPNHGQIAQLFIANCTFEVRLNDDSKYANGYCHQVEIDNPLGEVSCWNSIFISDGHLMTDENGSGETEGASTYKVWDYNQYFTENGHGYTTDLWRFSSTSIASDFAGWQSISGLDDNSAYGDPNLVGGVPSPAIAGTWLPGITNNATLGTNATPEKGAV